MATGHLVTGATFPTGLDPAIGSLWIDTSGTPATIKWCSAITPTTVWEPVSTMIPDPIQTASTMDIYFRPGSITRELDDPFIIASGWLGDLGSNTGTILWTDAARAPQTISSLLVIGI